VLGRPHNLVVAPSIIDGKRYELIERCPMAPLPAAHLNFIRAHYAKQHQAGQRTLEGGRNDTMFREACRMRHADEAKDEAWKKLRGLNQELCVPPLEESELRKLFEQSYKYPPGYDRTEFGNAKRLVDRFGRDLRYVVGDKFYTWAGQRWDEDQDNLRVMRWAKEIIRDIRDEAGAAENPDEAKKTFAWALTSQAAHHMEASLRLARSEPIAIKASEFDADPMLLGARNGVVNLRDGTFRESRREDYISKNLGSKFQAGAESALWKRFITRITDGDPAYIGFLQRTVGYTLTGLTTERCFFFTYGTGDNGKSVFLEIIKALLGTYGINIRTDTIMAHVRRNKGGASEDEARLAGARMVTANETEEGQKFDAALIKDFTGGGDTITARFLFKGSFEYVPRFKLWMRGNHRPSFSGGDAAMGRRLRLLPFTVTIPKSEQDGNLIPKLRAELPGILNWAIAGCIEWQRDGLGTPVNVVNATEEYIREEDVVGNFIEDRCEVGQEFSESLKNLYEAFEKWCPRSGGVPPESDKNLAAKLVRKGYTKVRSKAGMTIHGLRLTPIASDGTEYRQYGR
jgi:putative DNA primase/helicase